MSILATTNTAGVDLKYRPARIERGAKLAQPAPLELHPRTTKLDPKQDIHFARQLAKTKVDPADPNSRLSKRVTAVGADLQNHLMTPQDATKVQAGDLETFHHIGKTTATQHEQLTEKTRSWVSQTFFGTLLKQMGDSPFKSELFSGGRGGQAFSELYHQRLAEHMSKGAGSKLVNSIVRRIEEKSTAAQSKAGQEKKQTAGDDKAVPARQTAARKYARPAAPSQWSLAG